MFSGSVGRCFTDFCFKRFLRQYTPECYKVSWLLKQQPGCIKCLVPSVSAKALSFCPSVYEHVARLDGVASNRHRNPWTNVTIQRYAQSTMRNCKRSTHWPPWPAGQVGRRLWRPSYSSYKWGLEFCWGARVERGAKKKGAAGKQSRSDRTTLFKDEHRWSRRALKKPE